MQGVQGIEEERNYNLGSGCLWSVPRPTSSPEWLFRIVRYVRGSFSSAPSADIRGMLEPVLNGEHFERVLGEALRRCRHRLLIATANVKNLHLPTPGASGGRRRRARSILREFDDLATRHVEVRLLHSAVPSGPFLADLKDHVPATLEMRRCPRIHAKVVVADGRWMYLGSANLTGAGLGAKSHRRRNFEAGIWTDELALIDDVCDMLDGVWTGQHCPQCGQRDHCPVPLEEPEL